MGKGHVVLESGYTFAEKGSVRTHSYPEAVLRVGMFADWFELRIGQNFVTQAQTVGDLYVGAKLALTEQRGYLPAIAVIPQMTVTDANRAAADGRVLPGLNVDCGWELLKDRFAIEAHEDARIGRSFGASQCPAGSRTVLPDLHTAS